MQSSIPVGKAPEMFKVGEFARLGRVSVKVLRHYDGLGLLRPARVDGESGYRYYRADQLPRLHRIVALKELGFSLEQIGWLLQDDRAPDQLRGMLELRRAEIAQRVRIEQARMIGVEARLRQIERTDGSPPYDVALRRLPPQPVAAIRATIVDPDDVAALFDEVEAHAARHGARSPDPPLLIHHDGEGATGIDVEVAVPLTHPVPRAGRVAVAELPGIAEAACVLHTGGYDTLGRAAEALRTWSEVYDYRPVGPLRAAYVRFGADCIGYRLPTAYLTEHPGQYLTELQLPVTPMPPHDERHAA